LPDFKTLGLCPKPCQGFALEPRLALPSFAARNKTRNILNFCEI
jgi:hypothetical protein